MGMDAGAKFRPKRWPWRRSVPLAAKRRALMRQAVQTPVAWPMCCRWSQPHARQ